MKDFANCGSINVEKSCCVRTSYHKSFCRDCEDICAADAIVFSPLPSINKSACIKCGLCYSSCKFSAINIQKDNEHLLKATENRQDIDIGCIFSDADIKVACISRITEDLLISWFADGKNVVIKKGDCKKCKFAGTLLYFTQSLKKSAVLARAMNIEPHIKIKTKKSDSVYIPKDQLSRREMFSSLRITTHKSKPKRELLIKTLKNRIKNDADYVDSARLSISSNCNLCGICEHVCPRDAILIKKGESRGSIYFNPSLCIACGVCEDACIHDAINLKKASVSNLLQKPYNVYDATKKICIRCKREFYSNNNDELCSVCRSKEKNKDKFLDFLNNI